MNANLKTLKNLNAKTLPHSGYTVDPTLAWTDGELAIYWFEADDDEDYQMIIRWPDDNNGLASWIVDTAEDAETVAYQIADLYSQAASPDAFVKLAIERLGFDKSDLCDI